MRRQEDDAVTLDVVLGKVRGVLERVRGMRREGRRKGRRRREDGVDAMLELREMVEEEVRIENWMVVVSN